MYASYSFHDRLLLRSTDLACASALFLWLAAVDEKCNQTNDENVRGNITQHCSEFAEIHGPTFADLYPHDPLYIVKCLFVLVGHGAVRLNGLDGEWDFELDAVFPIVDEMALIGNALGLDVRQSVLLDYWYSKN